MADEIVIPDKAAFKAAEVCDLLKLQPYVLKSWENEFKDLGVSKAAGGPRVYRRVDVERAVRIRELVLREGLTLAGVRRRLEQEAATADAEDELIAEISAPGSVPATPPPGMTAVERERVAQVKQGLRELLDALSRPAAPVAARTSGRDTGAGDGAAAAGAGLQSHGAERAPLEVGEVAVPPVGDPPADAADAGAVEKAPPSPARELTIVMDEAPSLFAEDEAVVARAAAPPVKPAARRKRQPRASEPDAN